MNCGCPTPKPSSGCCGSQPASVRRSVTRVPTGSSTAPGRSVSRAIAGSARPAFTRAALQGCVRTGGPRRIANAPRALRRAARGSSQASMSPVQSMRGPSGRQARVKRSRRGTGRCRTRPAPTRRRPSNQPRDSPRHSALTCAHAGVWRKPADRRARTNARCSAAPIGAMVRPAGRADELEDMAPAKGAGCCRGVCGCGYAEDMRGHPAHPDFTTRSWPPPAHGRCPSPAAATRSSGPRPASGSGRSARPGTPPAS